MSQTSTRRNFLKLSGTLATGAVPATLLPSSAQAATAVKITSLKELKPLEPVAFTYPADAAAVLIDMGAPVPQGVGPRRSIVAFSGLCQHMGCPVTFDKQSKSLNCPCHASMFDPAREGMAFEGPATRPLPRIALRVDGKGEIYATEVASGLVYGRACDANRRA